MAIEDLVNAGPAAPTPGADENSAGDNAYATPENADDVLDGGENALAPRTEARIKALADKANAAEAALVQSQAQSAQMMERLAKAEGAMEVMQTSQTSNDPLGNLSIEDLKAIKANPEKYDADEQTLADVDSKIINHLVDQKLSGHLSALDAKEQAKQSQDQAYRLANLYGGDILQNNQDPVNILASQKMAQLEQEFGVGNPLAPTVALALAQKELNGGLVDQLQNENRTLAERNRIEGSARDAGSAISNLKDFMAKNKGGLTKSRQGQHDGSIRGAIKQLNLVKNLGG